MPDKVIDAGAGSGSVDKVDDQRAGHSGTDVDRADCPVPISSSEESTLKKRKYDIYEKKRQRKFQNF